MRRALCALVLALMPGLALATPPETSLRPMARLSQGRAVQGILPVTLPMAPPPGLMPATPVIRAMPGVRPAPRPMRQASPQAPRPRARPEAASETPSPGLTIKAPSRLAVLVALRPPMRPAGLARTARQAAYVTQPLPGAIAGRKGAVCGDPAIRGVTIAPIAAKVKGCGLKDGVRVTSVAGVRLSTPANIDCTTAKALKTWVERSAIPAVGKRGGGLAALTVAASYSCRTRNNQPGAKVSEHGRGRAIDISGFVLANGTSASVLAGWGDGAAGKSLAAMRKGACGPFTTVLGPGSDRFHRDHLHLDTTRGRGPYCR